MKRLLALLILLAAPAWAATYYVDNCDVTGNDGNNGTSTSTPWLTINKVNTSSFSAGDSILFRAACTWREQLTVSSSGSAGNPITFGAYGSGDDPKIFGSINKDSAGDWTQEAGTVTNWSAGMEGNDFSEWTTETDPDNLIAPSSTRAHGGTYSFYVNDTSVHTGWLRKTGIGNVSNATTYFWINFSGTTQDDDHYIQNAASNTRCTIQIRYSAPNFRVRVSIVDDSSAETYTSFYNITNTQDTWHKIAIIFTTHASNGGVELQIDDVSKEVISGKATTTATVDRFWWAHYSTQAYFDDFAVTSAGGDTNLWYVPSITINPNVIWRDGVRMSKVTNKVDLTEVGEWWMDDPNDRVYVYSGASAPTVGGHTYEIPQQAQAISAGTSVDYIIIDGLIISYTNWRGILVTDNNDHWTIQNCTITQCHGDGIRANNATYIDILHNTVSYVGINDEADPSEEIGIFVWNWEHALVHGNVVSYTGRAGILFGEPTSHSFVCEYNNVSHPGQNGNHAYGIQIYGDASGSTLSDVEIRYNYVHNCGHCNIYLIDKLDDIRIHGNILADAGSLGSGDMLANLSGFATSTSYEVTNLKVYNNVLYQGTNLPHGKHNVRIPVESNWEGALFKNNIFYHVGSWGNDLTYCCNATHTTPPTFDYNVHYRPNDTEDAIFKIENTDYLWAARPAGFEDNGINDNPDFTTPGSDFTLQAGSPCIEAGVNLGSTYLEQLLAGSTWPAAVETMDWHKTGGAPDVGAYDYRKLIW